MSVQVPKTCALWLSWLGWTWTANRGNHPVWELHKFRPGILAAKSLCIGILPDASDREFRDGNVNLCHVGLRGQVSSSIYVVR